MSLFNETSYKDALRAALEEKREKGSQLSLAGLAEAARIQRSYLSRVLNQDGQLNSDQLFFACKYLKLSAAETRFVALLLEYERSAVEERKSEIERKIQKIRRKALVTENYISSPSDDVSARRRTLFHLDPTTQLVHMFLSIKRYAKATKLIERDLGITTAELQKSLDLLVDLELIKQKNGAWIVPTPDMHLSRDSDLYPSYRALMRLKALEKLQKSTTDDTYSFSVLMSSDPKTRAAIQEAFLKFLSTIEPMVKRSDPEQVYQINFDLISWCTSRA